MTGYTHELISKGLDFNGFVWSCARAFGALIEMRDEPSDATIPERFEPSSYYADRIADTKIELANWDKMTASQRWDWAEARRVELFDSAQKGLDERMKQNAKLRAILAEVEAWIPPTADHAGLKRFMAEQITMSIDDTKWFEEAIAKYSSRSILPALVAEHDKNLRSELPRLEKSLQEERDRVASRNGWVQSLRESVGPPPGSPTATVG